MRLFLLISYDGTAYHGWQTQPRAVTVQEVVEEKLSRLMGQPMAVVGSGRTDAGVHAEAQWCHADFPTLPPPDFAYRLNCLLPSDIAVLDICRPAMPELHARFSATARSYRYTIARHKTPLLRHASLLHTSALDAEAMQQAAAVLLQHHDFASFCKAGGNQHTTLCRISRAEWVFSPEHAPHCWEFHITADRFLRGMVRAIVGTLLDVGKGKRSPADVDTLISARNRSMAGMAAPAQGLSLCRVSYPDGSLLPLEHPEIT
jgi:tRNA pseudouridine38-40 synthase